MKKFSKILSIALLVALVLSLGITSAFAADTGTITITVPTQQTAPTKPVTYKIYKVFDATVNATDNTKVNYTLCSGDTLSAAMTAAGFSVDTAGNVSGPTSLNDAAIAAIATYVTNADLVDTVTAAVGTTSVTSSALPFGYYYITTTTGSVVTIDSNNDNPTVKDKNKIPKVVKSAGTQYDAASQAAIDAVGTSQSFTSQIDVGNGAVNLVFTDTMTNMTFDGTVTITVSAGTAPVAGTDYTLTGAAGDSSFSIAFTDAYIAKLAANTLINITYSGTITSDGLSVNPATNTAKITSGDGNESSSDPVKVYNAKFTVTKQDGSSKPLAGAGFVIKNADGKYYKLNAATATAPASISWVDSINDADEHVSDAQGAVAPFTGLGVGTYTLEEKTVPGGYNKAADQTFTIADKDYTAANLEQTATVVNQEGAELPSTGGIGTTLFYVIGSILVLGAGVVLVAKKRAID